MTTKYTVTWLTDGGGTLQETFEADGLAILPNGAVGFIRNTKVRTLSIGPQGQQEQAPGEIIGCVFGFSSIKQIG